MRRGVIAVSLLGAACMAATTLLQTGLVAKLPDPPLRGFATKRVDSSPEAYSYGGPDSSVVIAAHAVNMILASRGGSRRVDKQPWLPIAAALVAGAQAAFAGKYLFYQIPKIEKAWCPYCIPDALPHFATFAMTMPEAIRSGRTLLRRIT